MARRPKASTSNGKNAINMVNAIACLSATQSGKSRPKARSRFVSILSIGLPAQLYGNTDRPRLLFFRGPLLGGWAAPPCRGQFQGVHCTRNVEKSKLRPR